MSSQEQILFTEINLAKNYAIQANHLSNEIKNRLNEETQGNNSRDNNINQLYQKFENLLLVLKNANIQGISDASLNIDNL